MKLGMVLIFFTLLSSPGLGFAQSAQVEADTTEIAHIDSVLADSDSLTTAAADSGKKSPMIYMDLQPNFLKKRNENSTSTGLRKPVPGMPIMRMSRKDEKFGVNLSTTHPGFQDPRDQTNYDALNKPATSTPDESVYNTIDPAVIIPPVDTAPEEFKEPIKYEDFVLPTREEYDILEILWTHGDVPDTAVYLTLDSTYNTKVTMADVNRILEGMQDKNLVSRVLVSPANELTLSALVVATKVEMSPKNRRNRVYEYRTRVDLESMKRFIRTNAARYKDDSMVVYQNNMRAARQDSLLLDELDFRIHSMKGENEKNGY